MNKKQKIWLGKIITVLLSFLLAECNTTVHENKETPKSEVNIDSANDAWLDCYINQDKWEKSDTLSASFLVK